MNGPIATLLSAKYRIIDNFVREVRSHVWIHVAAGFVTMTMIVGGGGAFFTWLFRFLLGQEPFGPPLLERLVGIVLLAFFSMLVFSNLVITLTTTYISKETEFLFAFPVRDRSLFVVKLLESVVYSSWAFAVLSLPLFAAYGNAKDAPLAYYPFVIALGLPFLVIPACIGAVLTMTLSAYLPARKARLYSFGLLFAAFGITAAIVRLMGLRTMVIRADLQDFSQLMAFLNVGSLPLLPNYWFARGLQAASERQYGEAGYWFLCLLSTALMAVQVCLWISGRLYYRGWALARESGSAAHASSSRWSLFPALDRLFHAFSPPVRALLSKDMRTFWRDPAQWSQLIILFGLLIIYIANIRGLARQLSAIDNYVKHWPTVLSFFNIGATCFVLSILTTRFIFPLLSLEGKQYWVIGLAPFPKRRLVWEKYWLCLLTTSAVAIILILFSNYMLRVSPALAWIGIGSILTIGLGLSSLGVGLGAVFPNFREDNPARIANGLGGTVNILVSLLYVAVNLGLELPPVLHLMLSLNNQVPPAAAVWSTLFSSWPYLAALAVLNLTAILLPMRMGLRKWERLEFHI